MTPFKCLEFDKCFTATYNSHLLPSRSDNSRQKFKKIGLKTWSLLRVEIILSRISWNVLKKDGNLQGWSTKNPLSLSVFFFCLEIFKGFNTLLQKHTCYDLWFSDQNFQNKTINFSEVFTKTSAQLLCLICCFFFPLEVHFFLSNPFCE